MHRPNPWKPILLALAVYAAALAETTLAPALRIGRISPDVLALAAMLWLLASPGRYAFLAAGLFAAAGDLLGPGRLGIGMAVWLVLGYAVTRWRERLALDRLPVQWIVLAVAVTAGGLLQAAARWMLGELPGPLGPLLSRVVAAEAYTAALSLPLLMVLNWMPCRAADRPTRLAEY
jgi:rod shape-determining protein MreD